MIHSASLDEVVQEVDGLAVLDGQGVVVLAVNAQEDEAHVVLGIEGEVGLLREALLKVSVIQDATEDWTLALDGGTHAAEAISANLDYLTQSAGNSTTGPLITRTVSTLVCAYDVTYHITSRRREVADQWICAPPLSLRSLCHLHFLDYF